MIIGKITIPTGNQTVEATLDSMLRWASADKILEHLLNDRFSANQYSPGHGQPGAKLLHDAAAVFKGQAQWLAPKQPEVPGRVY
jgi:hypothetical protein